MQQIIFLIHVLAAAGLVVMVLLQHGKGADMGAAFGSGASNTLFGSVGSLPFMVKVTAVFAVIFFASSLGLGLMIAKQAKPQAQSLIVAPQPTMPMPMSAPVHQSQPVTTNPLSTSTAPTVTLAPRLNHEKSINKKTAK